MEKLWLGALLMAALTQSGGAVDYCAPQYKCGRNHILACNNSGAFDTNYCTLNAKMISMTGEFKDMFVGEQNKLRNDIAKGLIYKPAAAMATLQWDQELSNLAVYNVKQCRFNYEEICLTSGLYSYIDQNIEYIHYSRNMYKFNEITNKMILADIKVAMKKSWFDQHQHCTQAEVDSYDPTMHVIMNFGRMMMDRNTRVGCAVGLFENHRFIYGLYTCNYARRLFCKKPIFRSGPRAGSKCVTGMNSRYPFLCSPKEPFSINNYSS